MKGRHKQGDTVIVEATVTGVDEGNLKDIYEKNADGTDNKDKVVGCEGDTFVHLTVLGAAVSVRGSGLADSVQPITAEELGESADAASPASDAQTNATVTESAGVDAPASESTPGAETVGAGSKSKK